MMVRDPFSSNYMAYGPTWTYLLNVPIPSPLLSLPLQSNAERNVVDFKDIIFLVYICKVASLLRVQSEIFLLGRNYHASIGDILQVVMWEGFFPFCQCSSQSYYSGKSNVDYGWGHQQDYEGGQSMLFGQLFLPKWSKHFVSHWPFPPEILIAWQFHS